MKIYFGFPVAGRGSVIDTARPGVLLLEKLGHIVLTSHLGK